jgi:hypothetical protein
VPSAKLLTVDQAAQMLGLPREQVIDLCKRREIVAQYLENTGSWVMTQRAVVAYLSRTRQWKAIRATLTHRVLLVDPDSRTHSLLLSALGRKSPVDLRLCTQPGEIQLAVKSFLPDCICVRIVRPRPDKDPLIEAVVEATRGRPSKAILYHNLQANALKEMPQLGEQIKNLHVEFLVNLTGGIQQLVEAILVEVGLKKA